MSILIEQLREDLRANADESARQSAKRYFKE